MAHMLYAVKGRNGLKAFDVLQAPSRYTAIEFFSGIGLARAGMKKAGIETIWANDIDETKCAIYRAQWGNQDLHCQDVFTVDPGSVPKADIAWASSPCTDLSLAGKRQGLVEGAESSAFFGFLTVIEKMGERKPRALVLENVCGLASSHDGNDFRIVVESFNRLGYSVDAFELNARRWLPQSRPRMFVVGLLNPIEGGSLDSALRPDKLSWIHSDRALKTHLTPLPAVPGLKVSGLTGLIDSIEPDNSCWWNNDKVEKFLASLSRVQTERVEKMMAGSSVVARTAYRRTRNGKPVWELRDDDIAGCLRTARGGSSKQAVVLLGRGGVSVRWMTGLEYAKLQGAKDYALGGFRESQIQYAFGDAVAVPVVTWLMRSAVLPAFRAEESLEEVRNAS